MWIIILTVCKFAGILITGIAGIISQLSKEHRGKIQNWVLRLATRLYDDNKERAQILASKVSNSIKKESCVGWAIFGVVVALISQSVETLKATHDDQESKKRTESQLQTAQKSLDYLERLSTRFDSLSVEVKFELDRNSEVFSALYDFADRFLNYVNTTNLLTPAAEARVGFWIKTNLPENRMGYTYAERPAKFYYVGVGSNAPVIVQTFFLEGDKQVSYHPTKNDDLLLLCKRFSTNAVNLQALQFIQQPRFDLGLSSAKTKNLDLSVEEITNSITPVFLTYVKATRKLYIDYSLVFPKTNWNQNKWMMSLPDLAGATFMISASDVPDAAIRPVEGNLSVDNMITIPLTNFTRILIFPNSSQFGCVLPDKQQILGTK
jgi:hypothetical protein